MNIKHSCGLNLSADAIPPRLHMVQGDANSRTIVATLWDGAQPYSIPAEAAVMVRFRKPDGTGGLYDTTESGNKVSYAGSIVTAPVATQMLAVAGDVFAEIDIFGSSSGAATERLATFRFVVEVAPCVLPDAEIISSDYYNILASNIADAKVAADLAKNYAASAKQSADSAATSVEGAIKYNAPQTLTEEQKQQARDNINVPTPYTAGENISISGSVIATKAFPCNPNLLDNWYFGNPVNQRNGYVVPPQTPYYTLSATEWNQVGVTEGYYAITGTNSGGEAYTISIGGTTYMVTKSAAVRGYTGEGYGIDRWRVENSTTIKLTNNGLVITTTNDNGITQNSEQLQYLLGKIVTFSMLTASGLYAITFDAGGISGGMNLSSFEIFSTSSWLLYVRHLGSGDSEAILAVKLELGPQQTLAHQENGVWVLNEIPDYGEQLRRCQRYYFKTGSAQYSAYMMRKVDDNYLMDSCIFPVTMRTTPSVQLVSYRNPTTGAVITAEGNASQTTPDGFCIVNDAGKFAGSSIFQVAFSATADL